MQKSKAKGGNPVMQYCFTLNLHPFLFSSKAELDEYVDAFKEHLSDDKLFKYACFGLERGKREPIVVPAADGKPKPLVSGALSIATHLQGFVSLVKRARPGGAKQIIGCDRRSREIIHLEVARGSIEQNRTYCMKEGKFWECGSWKSGGQGKRSDLHDLVDAIGSKSNPDLANDPDLKYAFFKFGKNVDHYRGALLGAPKDMQRYSILWQGNTGIGKSSLFRRFFNDVPVYDVTLPTNVASTFWFERYYGEKIGLVDEWKSEPAVSCERWLRLMDRYAIKMDVKYSSYPCQICVWLCSTNTDFDVLTNMWSRQQKDAFLRRCLYVKTTTDDACYDPASNPDDFSKVPKEILVGLSIIRKALDLPIIEGSYPVDDMLCLEAMLPQLVPWVMADNAHKDDDGAVVVRPPSPPAPPVPPNPPPTPVPARRPGDLPDFYDEEEEKENRPPNPVVLTRSLSPTQPRSPSPPVLSEVVVAHPNPPSPDDSQIPMEEEVPESQPGKRHDEYLALSKFGPGRYKFTPRM